MSLRVRSALAVVLLLGMTGCESDAGSTSPSTTVGVRDTERPVRESEGAQPGSTTTTASTRSTTTASTPPDTTPATTTTSDEEDPPPGDIQAERTPSTVPPSAPAGSESETSTTRPETTTTTTTTTAPPNTTSLSLSVEIHQPALHEAVVVEDRGAVYAFMTRGTSTGVTGDLRVVLLIHAVDPAGGGWFPMSAFSVDSEGRWEDIAFVGGQVGDKFEMIAVITDRSASAEIGRPDDLAPLAVSAIVPFTIGDMVRP